MVCGVNRIDYKMQITHQTQQLLIDLPTNHKFPFSNNVQILNTISEDIELFLPKSMGENYIEM